MWLRGTRRCLSAMGLFALAIALPLGMARAQVTYQTLTPNAPPAPSGPTPPVTVPDAAPANAVPPPPDPDVAAAPVPREPPPPQKADVNNPVKQTGQVIKDLATGNIKALQRGPLLIHGNYCGIGNRPGLPPTDALDEACMHHDACTTDGKLPNCACDNRLKEEAMRIAQDPATSPKIQVLAATMAASMEILICK